MFQASSVLKGTYYLLRAVHVAMLSFSVIIFHSAIEIGVYSLCRKKVIAAFKLNKNNCWVLVLVTEKQQ